jgi:hypothetical protein
MFRRVQAIWTLREVVGGFTVLNPAENTLIPRMRQPLLLLDIDGVISLFGFDLSHPPPGRWQLVDGIVHFLSTTAADFVHLLGAHFELVWCSGWEEKADEILPGALGIPRGLPHLSFAAAPGDAPDRHWKLPAIEAFAGPHRPAAWIDDVFDATCHAWATHRPGPTRLVQTDPAAGLTDAHATDLIAWTQTLRTPPS